MKCNFCGRDDAWVRPCEVSTFSPAAVHLRAHVDCAGHSEYRNITRADVEETQRLLDSAPEMVKLLKAVKSSEIDKVPDEEHIAIIVPRDTYVQISELLAKIKGGQN